MPEMVGDVLYLVVMIGYERCEMGRVSGRCGINVVGAILTKIYWWLVKRGCGPWGTMFDRR
jgi:hypothetical protein